MSISKGLDTAQPLVVVVAADVEEDEEGTEDLNNAIDFIFYLTYDGHCTGFLFWTHCLPPALVAQSIPN